VFARLPSAIDIAGADRAMALREPATVLVELVDELHADLLVIGSHAPGTWQSDALGSVSGHVARRAGCPMIILLGKLDRGSHEP
jgi:nucleotide-binding universal stress UspA family protein